MTNAYFTCFALGLVMSLLAAVTGLGRIHFGHLHFGHGHVPASGKSSGHGSGVGAAVNGFTLPAFLCWFGGAGYLLQTQSELSAAPILFLATGSGLFGAVLLYVALFRFLLPRERVLSAEETRMDGVVARVSDAIHAQGGTGEIIFSQTGARKSAAARSESGEEIQRGTEVVVLRYQRGIAYVSPMADDAAHL